MAKTRLYKRLTFLGGYFKGKEFNIYYSDDEVKKYEVDVFEDKVYFGAKGYTIQPGKKRGNNYCARSFGIKGRDDILSPNFWSSVTWRCDKRRTKNKQIFSTELGTVRVY